MTREKAVDTPPEAVEPAAASYDGEGPAAPEKVALELKSPSRGRRRGDVVEVSAERAVELVAAGLAKRVD